MKSATHAEYPIPEGLNLLILCAAIPAGWGLLWLGSHGVWWQAVLAAFIFAHVHNTPFSLLHEAAHGVFSRRRWLNEAAGTLCAATFPTSFTLQRIAHLGHHRRNRTDAELYDYYLPTQSIPLRNLWLFAGNLGGMYYFCLPLSNLVLLLAPWLYTSNWFVHGVARKLGFEAFIQEIVEHSLLRIWLECAFTLAYQIALWWLLDLHWQGVLLCHAAFALHWSALQYVDHAWSPRDVINGAWNLKVSAPARALALNYHFHLAHHRAPAVPWIHLPKLVRPEERQPTFWEIYFSLWGGVRPAPPMVERLG